MAALCWTKALELDVPAMDADHRRMVDAVASLMSDMTAGAAPAAIIETMADIGLFAARHFADEEASMRRHAYPGFRKHRNQHNALMQQLDHLSDRIAEDGMAAMDPLVVDFLRHWLVRHITTHDAAYATWLHATGDGF